MKVGNLYNIRVSFTLAFKNIFLKYIQNKILVNKLSAVLILIGIIMVASGIFVFYIGYKKSVPNTYLWAAFPILHGLHEFAEASLELGMPFIVERFEIFFAIAGAFVLLAAALEYNGVVARPIGKFAALIGLIGVSYFIFFLPEHIIEEMEHIKYDFGILVTNPIRFFQGMFMTILAIIALLLTSLYLVLRAKRGEITLDPKLIQITGISVILLSVYAFFEGFESEDPVFVTLRAISLSLFLIVPIFFILTNKLGLQRLLIIQEGGIPLLGYNFPSNTYLTIDSSESSDFVLAAGFLAAVSSFSGNVLKAGSTFSIRSKQLYFILTQVEGNIYALQSLHTNKNLERDFFEFGKHLNPKIPKTNSPDDLDLKTIGSEIQEHFSLYF
jgi:hypothetical protein